MDTIREQRQMAPVPLASRATGWRLFAKQFKALFWKNVLLSWRNYRATCLQLLSSLFFIFLIFIVAKAIDAQNKGKTGFKSVRTPEPFLIPALPACETGFYIKKPCYDFVYAPANLTSVNTIVENMRVQNPGRPIPPEKVRAFASAAEIDVWLLANPSHCPAAVIFQETALGLGYGLQVNSTVKNQRGNYEDVNFKFEAPLQQAVEREIIRYVTGDGPSLNWYTWLVEFAHPATTNFSAAGAVAPTFLFAAAMFGFVIQIGAVVAERELKLRQAMDTMGLKVSVFWLTWVAWEVVLVFISSLFIVIFGLMFQFDLFKRNGFFVLFILFFLFELAMAGLAFLVSTFLQSSAPATTLGFFIFILGFIVQLVTVFGFPYSKSFAPWIRYLWSLFPPNLLAIGLQYLGDATASKDDRGIKWSQITSHCGHGSTFGGVNNDCVFPLSNCYKYLFVEFLLFTLLATYLDRVFPDVNGVRRPWLFFLYPSYWTGAKGGYSGTTGCCSCTGREPPLPPATGVEDEDVIAEREKVEAQAQAGGPPPGVSVQLRQLRKTFAGTRSCSCKYCILCSCKATAPFHAVKGVSFTIEENKLFCLLGPNGAGKTTTINMLTGVLPATAGSALVYGNDITDAAGMARVRSFMGVCPQFDILWGDLTGREHLWLFANIRGLPKEQVKRETDELLAQVRLVEAGGVRSALYSGGMKRRLSVAVALIGDPKVVYLDEPTTGMDPISRRHVWDIIEACKPGRAFILTTHSMEEADILGDTIAIMAKGSMRCIGSSIHLKNKFGAGYIVNVSVRSAGSYVDLPGATSWDADAYKADAVKAFFKQGLGVEAVEESKAYIRFLVPRAAERVLPEFFAALQARRAELGVTDVQLSLSTLEEVFLAIARQAELETAHAEGRYDKITLADGTLLQVPIGAPYVALPGSASEEYPNGLMVEMTWQQDDAGRLMVSHHSEPVPAPAPAARFTQQDSGLGGRSRKSLPKNKSNIGQALTEVELAGATALPSTLEAAPPQGRMTRY